MTNYSTRAFRYMKKLSHWGLFKDDMTNYYWNFKWVKIEDAEMIVTAALMPVVLMMMMMLLPLKLSTQPG